MGIMTLNRPILGQPPQHEIPFGSRQSMESRLPSVDDRARSISLRAQTDQVVESFRIDLYPGYKPAKTLDYASGKKHNVVVKRAGAMALLKPLSLRLRTI
jgi:hypothetical protein